VFSVREAIRNDLLNAPHVSGGTLAAAILCKLVRCVYALLSGRFSA